MEKLYDLALCQVKGVGPNTYKTLITQGNSAEEIFNLSLERLKKITGSNVAQNIKSYSDFDFIKQVIHKTENSSTNITTISDDLYPKLLKQTPDSPIILFHKGFLPQKTVNISIVGTRNATSYGKDVVDEICSQLPQNTCIISGLALGIDTFAHKSALQHNLKTAAVLGSATDMVYPKSNVRLANDILANEGCLISEYLPGTKAEVHHFPMRNRIVAGMSEITIVVESKTKGGSLITAKIANDYNREVYAIPGAIHDKNSQGCNELIASHGANIFTSVEQMLDSINVFVENRKTQRLQTLDIEIDTNEKIIFNELINSQSDTIDTIARTTLLPVNKIASLLLTLEFKGIVSALPGNKFKLKEKYKACRELH